MNTRNSLLFIITFFVLSAFSQQDDLAIINNYLENNIEKFSFKTNDINDIVINDRVDSESKFTSIYVQQRINGIDIFNAISTATIKDNSVANFANRFLPLIENKINVTGPSIAPVDAIISAANKLNLVLTKDLTLIEESENHFKYIAPSISTDDINAKLVYYPMPDSL
jgi:extracellular elastinolytic metalloproteinase